MPRRNPTPNPLGLRPDVSECVELSILNDSLYSDRDAWVAYERFKWALSRLCGWDAPPAAYDQSQYDRAMARYLEGVRL